jgi:nucleotidyltransferase/DNA polymerase involved in DNA repair
MKLLSELRNVGPAALADFKLLGISSVAQLKTCQPDELYQRLQVITNSAHDPCVWDVLAAAIHQAKTGEAINWWAFTAERKAKFAKLPKV